MVRLRQLDSRAEQLLEAGRYRRRGAQARNRRIACVSLQQAPHRVASRRIVRRRRAGVAGIGFVFDRRDYLIEGALRDALDRLAVVTAYEAVRYEVTVGLKLFKFRGCEDTTGVSEHGVIVTPRRAYDGASRAAWGRQKKTA